MLFGSLALGGCLSVDATAPESIVLNGREVYAAAPPANIPVADPNSTQDLRRENQQLQDRIVWLDGHIQKLQNSSNGLARKIGEAAAKLRKLTAQLERAKRGKGGAL